MRTTDMINPWFGLRSYPEGARIFGRDKEIVELSQKILYNTQTVIYGKSGIGKSSILNAGVFPILRRENYFPVYIRLIHDGMVSYTTQILTAVLESLKRLRVEDLGAPEDSIYKDVEGYTKVTAERYNTSVEEGLWEFFHRHEFFYRIDEQSEEQSVAPVLIFDQFEEIFTLQKDLSKTDAFFNELASLLNNICPKQLLQDTVEVSERKTEGSSTGSLIKKGIVRKSTKLDYLGDTNMRLVLSLREDYLSYLERNIANIPSLKHNRYCLRPLSEEQAADIITKPIPGMIDLQVAKSIICKVTGAKPTPFEFDDDKSDIEVDSAILSLFLTELYKKKPADKPRMTLEMVDSLGANIISDFYKNSIAHIPEASVHFMEDNLITEGGRRDNIPLSKALTGISKKDLDYLERERLVHKFPWNGEMRVEFMHDILCDTISQTRDERIERIRTERKDAALRAMRRRNRITIFSIFLLILCISAYYFCFLFPVSEKYASTTKVWGEYKGVGHLTSKQASYLPYHFVLKKKGLASKVYSSMECRDGYGAFSTKHSITPYIIPGGVSEADTTLVNGVAEKLESVCQWAFVRDLKNKKVIQERAYNDKHELVYACSYSTVTISQDKASASSKKRSDTSSVRSRKTSVETVVIGSYVDEQGLPMILLKSGFCFARITYNDAGHDKLIEYFDWEGNPAVNSDGAYQAYFEYNDMGLMTSMSSLNRYGKRMIDKAGNCGMIITYDGYLKTEIRCVDEFGREKDVNDGYSKATLKYDDKGREEEMVLWSKGNPVCPDGLFHKRTMTYEENSVIMHLYDTADVLLYSEKAVYNPNGQLVSFEAEDGHNRRVLYSEYDENGSRSYSEEITVSGTDTIGVYIYKKEGRREMRRYEGDIYSNYINYTSYDEKDRIINEAYYQLDGITPYEDDYLWHNIEKTYREKDEGAKSIWTEIIDSTCYYSEAGLSYIEVNVKYPARNTGKYKLYEADGTNVILTHSESRHYDAYGNPIEIISDDRPVIKSYNFVNAKTKELDGSSLTLTRYGFPTAEFQVAGLDENGNRTEDPDYSLPSIYNGDKHKKAVFIEIIDKGRNFHGVLLESDSGVCYNAENYDQANFGYTNTVVYLNLTTMNIEETPLYTWERYWTIFNCNITEEEHQLYLEHYQRYLDERLIQQ